MATSVLSDIRPLAIDDRNREVDFRAGLMAILGASPSSPIAADGGMLPSAYSAEVSSTGTAGAPKTTVQPYRVVIPSATNYGWIGRQPVSAQVDHAAPNPTNPRIDLIIARVTGGSLSTEVVTGTPAASPSPPDGSVPADSFVLWNVTVATSGALTFTSRRWWTTAAGGVRILTGNSRVGAYAGELRVDPTTGQVDEWTGAAWVALASPAQWSQYTPVLRYRGGAGGTVGLGTGSSSIGRYIKLGTTLLIRVVFRWGTGPFNGGTSEIYTNLPAGIVSSTTEISRIPCQLYTTTTGPMDWSGLATVFANNTELRPMFPFSPGDCRLAFYAVANTAGVANSGVPTAPASSGYFPEGGSLVIQGSIEVQP